MTNQDRELLDSIDQMIADAPKMGLCAASFMALRAEVERLIGEKENAQECC